MLAGPKALLGQVLSKLFKDAVFLSSDQTVSPVRCLMLPVTPQPPLFYDFNLRTPVSRLEVRDFYCVFNSSTLAKLVRALHRVIFE